MGSHRSLEGTAASLRSCRLPRSFNNNSFTEALENTQKDVGPGGFAVFPTGKQSSSSCELLPQADITTLLLLARTWSRIRQPTHTIHLAFRVPAGTLHVTQNEHCVPATIMALFASSNPSASFYPFTEVCCLPGPGQLLARPAV